MKQCVTLLVLTLLRKRSGLSCTEEVTPFPRNTLMSAFVKKVCSARTPENPESGANVAMPRKDARHATARKQDVTVERSASYQC